MGDAKQLRRTLLWNTFGPLVYMVCHFLFGILILSLAGAEQSGIFTTAVSATGIFLSIASYGMYNFQVSDAHEKYAQSCYIRSRAYTLSLIHISSRRWPERCAFPTRAATARTVPWHAPQMRCCG